MAVYLIKGYQVRKANATLLHKSLRAVPAIVSRIYGLGQPESSGRTNDCALAFAVIAISEARSLNSGIAVPNDGATRASASHNGGAPIVDAD